MAEWSDLSDDELRARLEQRGIPSFVVDTLIRWRDEPDVAERITEDLQATRKDQT